MKDKWKILELPKHFNIKSKAWLNDPTVAHKILDGVKHDNKENTNARRLRFHCCNFSFGINQCPSASQVGSRFIILSSSNNIVEYLSSRGLHKPKSESFKWPFLSSIRLSGLMSLQSTEISQVKIWTALVAKYFKSSNYLTISN